MASIAPVNAVPPPRILLVEDNSIQAHIITAVVKQMGLCPVGPVATALEALELCRYELPDLAILDINLQGEMDGIDLAINLRSLGKIPLIFVSANSSSFLSERMKQVRPQAMLVKPYKPSLLQQAISHGLLSPAAPLPIPSTGFTYVPAATGLFVREGNTLVRLVVANIMSVQAVQKHAVITMNTGRRHTVRLTLAEVLAHLPTDDFMQCHRAWIVNMRHVEHVQLSTHIVRLTDGTEALIGRAYQQNIQQGLHIIG